MLHMTTVTLDSCNSGHSENYEKIGIITWNFLQNGIDNFVIQLIHSCENCDQKGLFTF